MLTNVGLSPAAESVCCIYHKARKFGESSSEESSSDSDSDSDYDHSHQNHRHYQSASGGGGAERERNGEGAQVKELESDDEPNAYERPPGWKKNKGKRNANGKLKDPRPIDFLLTQRSMMDLPFVTHHASCFSNSRGRCKHEISLDPYLPEARPRRHMTSVIPDVRYSLLTVIVILVQG